MKIPPHGRWRHLDAGVDRINPMIAQWTDVDDKEKAKRTIDLFVVSVLLDAGAGNAWKYSEEASGQTFNRSEGLGVASVHMFQSGLFSSDSEQPYRVDGADLSSSRNLTFTSRQLRACRKLLLKRLQRRCK